LRADEDGAFRIMTRQLVGVLGLLATAVAQTAPVAAKQNPSPMVDNTRAHKRVAQIERRGSRMPLSLGTLFIPDHAKNRSKIPLIIHFHGATWLAEQSAAQFDAHAAVLTVSLGAGSGMYSQAFADPTRFRTLLTEASGAVSPPGTMRFDAVVLTAFSAGYGAIREILKNRDNWQLLYGVVLADGFHTGYVPEGSPGSLDPEPLRPFVEFAREAMAGQKRMVITHSEIFPGTFASTTECTDYLISTLGLHRTPVLNWGPGGMQQLSTVRSGHLQILGFAGNSAPDHIDHFHGLGHWLKLLKR
jgi:hypothetical protein